MRLLLVSLLFLCSCDHQQTNWKTNLYVDVSVSGAEEYGDTTVSAGLSYPIVGDLWATVGLWRGVNKDWGPYWGISYSFNPFDREKKKKD